MMKHTRAIRVSVVAGLLLAAAALSGALQPAQALPPAGTDQLPVVVTVDGVSRLGKESVTLTGWIEIQRDAPHMEGNIEVVDMELISMDLVGASSIGAITVTERANSGPNFISVGEIREKVSGQDFPASSFFDVFADVTVPADPAPPTLVVHNRENWPLRVTPTTNITAWPPLGAIYNLEPIFGFDNDGDTTPDEDSSDDDGDLAYDEDPPGDGFGNCSTPFGQANDDCDTMLDEDPPLAQCTLVLCDEDGDTDIDEDPGCVPLFDEANHSLPAGFCVRDMTMEVAPETPSFSVDRNGPSGRHPADILALTPGYPPPPPPPPPPTAVSGNDPFAGGWDVSGLPFTGQQNTQTPVTFTTEAGEPNLPSCLLGSTTSKSAWYDLTPAATGPITIDTIGSNFDTVITVYTGNAVNALTLVACDDDSGGGTRSQVTFSATSGVTYRVRAASWSISGGGTLLLNISEGGGGASGDAPFVRIDCSDLGLTADGCDSGGDGDQDNIDALSYGQDMPPGTSPALNFSVAPGSIGAVGSAVRAQTQCPPASPGTSPEPEPDEFVSTLNSLNTLVLDGNGPIGSCTSAFPLGLIESASARDNLDALDRLDPAAVDADFDGVPEAPVYFSLDNTSPSLGANSPADILKTVNGGAPAVYAAKAALGLETGDDIDALCLKESGNGLYTAGVDTVLFSLTPGSPTLSQISAGGADILAPGVSNPTVLVQETSLGLVVADDVDALKCNLLKDDAGDTDNDGIPNGTDPDDDNDGCTDVQENGPDQQLGGLRDPHNFWDFFDVPTGAGLTRDKAVSGLDIFAVLGRFNATGNPGIDPLSTPPAAPAYHTAYDRGGVIGPNTWNLGPANGSIAATDIFSSLAQFGHSCI